MPVDAPPPPAKLSTISSCRSNAYWLPSAIAVHLLHAMALFADGRRVDATPAAAGPDVVNGLRAAAGALGELARDAVASVLFCELDIAHVRRQPPGVVTAARGLGQRQQGHVVRVGAGDIAAGPAHLPSARERAEQPR